MPGKKDKPRLNTVHGVVFGALPSLAHLFGSIDAASPPYSALGDGWTMVTPVSSGPLLRDFPLLPVDLKTTSSRVLGSIVSSFKAIPNAETWPMTPTSIGLSRQYFDRKVVFRVRCEDLADMWFALPGSGGTVRTLEWYRDISGMAHESVVLQVTGTPGALSEHEETWWVRLERYPDGDFAMLSREKFRVVGPESKTRAELTFPDNGVSFAHVVRILKIIHEVSPHYFVIGANCWFYASTIVEMLDLSGSGRWTKGGGLSLTDHHMTKDFNYQQHNEINQRVRQLVPNSTKKAKRSTGIWYNLISAS